MERSFENLVQSVEDSLHGCPLGEIKRSLKFIPLDLKWDLGDCFRDRALNFLVAVNITSEQFFLECSYFWDFLNPGLLCFLVKRHGSPENVKSMEAYLQELRTFRQGVTVGEFVKVSRADIKAKGFHYKKIIMKMDPEWEYKTLEDAEEFKVEFCNANRFPQSITTRMDAVNSCVAIVFYVPIQVEISLEKLKPLLKRKKVVKVYLDNVCIVDWTKQVQITQCPVTKLGGGGGGWVHY